MLSSFSFLQWVLTWQGYKISLREVSSLSRLGEHDQIPALYANPEEGGRFYIVQEWIEGQTLTKVVKTQGVLNEGQVKHLLKNVLPVLEYVHSKGIIHRDIKPENIIFRHSDKQCVLIDFGAVKAMIETAGYGRQNVQAATIVGTPDYMPMEQRQGQPTYESDLYSLGLTAIYLLTGQDPSEFSVNSRIRRRDWWNSRSGISREFKTFLDRAIHEEKDKRFGSATEMLTALTSKRPSIWEMLATSTVAAIFIVLLGLFFAYRRNVADPYIVPTRTQEPELIPQPKPLADQIPQPEPDLSPLSIPQQKPDIPPAIYGTVVSDPASSGRKNIRSEPDGQTVGVVFKGDRLKILDRENDSSGRPWLMVEVYGGSSAWIASWLMETGSMDRPTSGQLKSEANIREDPGRSYKAIHTAPAGSSVFVYGSARDSDDYIWYEVSFTGTDTQGWIEGSLLEIETERE